MIIPFLVIILIIGGSIYYFGYYRPAKKSAELASRPVITFSEGDVELALKVSMEHDVQRKLDLANLQEALESFYNDRGHYPATDGKVIKTFEKYSVLKDELVKKKYINELPLDPLDPRFDYRYYSDGLSYEITCILENENDAQGIKVGDFNIYKVVSPEHKNEQ